MSCVTEWYATNSTHHCEIGKNDGILRKSRCIIFPNTFRHRNCLPTGVRWMPAMLCYRRKVWLLSWVSLWLWYQSRFLRIAVYPKGGGFPARTKHRLQVSKLTYNSIARRMCYVWVKREHWWHISNRLCHTFDSKRSTTEWRQWMWNR